MTHSAVCSPDLCFVPPRSTGKERDTESGNDYFGARYYASSMGRMMSPDYSDEDDGPQAIPYYNPSNPQSLNLYSYVHNNPLTGVDPDGHDCVVQTRTSNTTESVSVSSGTCAGVKVGDGQSATYVNGTVTGVKAGSDGHSIDIGFNSYDGQSSGVQNAGGAPIPDNPGIAPGWGNNQQGYNTLGTASATVGSVKGVAAFYGASALGAAGAYAAGLTAGADLTTLGSLAGETTHSGEAALLARHGITPEQARAAIEAAKKSGNVVEAMGRYGPQLRYTANGIRVVVATTGRNAGKIITAFFK